MDDLKKDLMNILIEENKKIIELLFRLLIIKKSKYIQKY